MGRICSIRHNPMDLGSVGNGKCILINLMAAHGWHRIRPQLLNLAKKVEAKEEEMPI